MIHHENRKDHDVVKAVRKFPLHRALCRLVDQVQVNVLELDARRGEKINRLVTEGAGRERKNRYLVIPQGAIHCFERKRIYCFFHTLKVVLFSHDFQGIPGRYSPGAVSRRGGGSSPGYCGELFVKLGIDKAVGIRNKGRRGGGVHVKTEDQACRSPGIPIGKGNHLGISGKDPLEQGRVIQDELCSGGRPVELQNDRGYGEERFRVVLVQGDILVGKNTLPGFLISGTPRSCAASQEDDQGQCKGRSNPRDVPTGDHQTPEGWIVEEEPEPTGPALQDPFIHGTHHG